MNCLHVLDELRPLEEKYAEELVVVGVHSPKFVHEADPEALAAAVERYGVHHPVLDDPELITWQAVHRAGLADARAGRPGGLRRRAVRRRGPRPRDRRAARPSWSSEHRAKGTLQPGDSPYVAAGRASRPTCASRPRRCRARRRHAAGRRRRARRGRRAGRGRRTGACAGFGGFTRAQRPVPAAAEVAAAVGYDVVVADTVHHQLRGHRRWRPARCACSPATATQWMHGRRHRPALQPVGRGLVAATGCGSRWPASTSCGPSTRAPAPSRWRPAPPTRGCSTARSAEAWFAQTTGLAAGRRPAVARRQRDLRRCAGVDARRRRSHTAVGTGLFDFGFRDGPADQALLQHPLGVTRAARRQRRGLRHLQRRGPPLRPGDRRGHDAGHRPGRAQRRVRRRRPAGRRRVGRAPADPGAARRRRGPHATASPTAPSARSPRWPAVAGAGGRASTPPPGQKVDDRFGPPSQLVVEATPAGAAPRRRRPRHRPRPARSSLDPRGRRGRAARRRPGGVLRRRRRRGRGLPHAPAGLGRAGPGQRRRRRPPRAAAGRRRSRRVNERRVGCASTSDGSASWGVNKRRVGGGRAARPTSPRRRCGRWVAAPVDSGTASGRPSLREGRSSLKPGGGARFRPRKTS